MYGDINNIRLLTGINSNELTDTELNNYLSLIQSELYNYVKTDKVFDRRLLIPNSDGTYNRKQYLYFKPDQSTSIEVYLNGKKLDQSQYTVNLDEASITLNSDVEITPYSVFVVIYTPELINRLAELLAIKKIYLTRSIDLPNGATTNTVIDRIDKEIQGVIQQINSQPYLSSWTEHREEIDVW